MDHQRTTNIQNCGINQGAGGSITAENVTIINNPSTAGTSAASSKNPLRFNIPSPTRHFKGRRDTMEAVRNYFLKLPPQPEDCWDRIVAIVGLGGMGKTETAYKFAAEFKATFPNVAWINAETKSSALASFLGLAKHLKIASNDRKEADLDLVKEVYLHLDQEDHGRVLFILDNAVRLHSDEEEFGIMEYLPSDDLPNQRFPYVLITTQTHDWDRRIETFQVDELTQVESLQFFRSCFAIESAECDDLFNKLHKLLEGYPLVMNLAASQFDFNPRRHSVHQLKQQIQNYIDRLEKENIKILHDKFNRAWPTKYKKTLSNVWQLTFERIQQEKNGSDALELLQHMSFLHVPIKSNVVRGMLALGSDCPHPPLTELNLRLQELIRILERFYTLRILNDDNYSLELGIHRLVQFVVRQQMDSRKGLERVLFYFARVYKKNYSVNKSALEEALLRIPLGQHILPYVGVLACQGFPPACKFVKTRPPETKAAATIWRLYSLERGMKTLNQNATQVLRELIELIKSAERLADRYFFGYITMAILIFKNYCTHTREDGTKAPRFFDLDSLDGIEELVAQLIWNVCYLQDLSCKSHYCHLRRQTMDAWLVSLIVKLSKTFIQADAQCSMLAVDVISDTWFALFARLKYYEPHKRDFPGFFKDFWLEIYDAFQSPNASQSRIGALKTSLWNLGLAEVLIPLLRCKDLLEYSVGTASLLWYLRMMDFCIDRMDLRDESVQEVISSIFEMAARAEEIFRDRHRWRCHLEREHDERRVEKPFISRDHLEPGWIDFRISLCSFSAKLLLMNEDPPPQKFLDSISQLKFRVWTERRWESDRGKDSFHGDRLRCSPLGIPREFGSEHLQQFIERFSSSEIRPIKTLVNVIRRLIEDYKDYNL